MTDPVSHIPHILLTKGLQHSNPSTTVIPAEVTRRDPRWATKGEPAWLSLECSLLEQPPCHEGAQAATGRSHIQVFQ